MKTVEEVVKALKRVDELFLDDLLMRNSLKIDLFKDIDDEVFFEALRQTNIDYESFKTISYTRHKEANKQVKVGEQELLKAIEILNDKNLASDPNNLRKVVMSFAHYLADESNVLVVYMNQNNNPYAIEVDNDVYPCVYTSYQELCKNNPGNKDYYFVVNSAYKVFKDLSSNPRFSGISINNAFLFIIKDIIKEILTYADEVRKNDKIE